MIYVKASNPLTFEGEEDKESEVVASLCGIADVIKETEMIVGALDKQGVRERTTESQHNIRRE